jgi:hypothetical protein
MGMLDGLLGQLSEHVDVADLAQKIGIPPEMAASAIGALAQAHADPGDTVQVAQGATGLSSDTLNQIISHIGGEGALANYASILTSSGVLGALTGGAKDAGAAEGDEAQGGIGGILGSIGGMFGGKS